MSQFRHSLDLLVRTAKVERSRHVVLRLAMEAAIAARRGVAGLGELAERGERLLDDRGALIRPLDSLTKDEATIAVDIILRMHLLSMREELTAKKAELKTAP